jgi:hypothetical protein
MTNNHKGLVLVFLLIAALHTLAAPGGSDAPPFLSGDDDDVSLILAGGFGGEYVTS